MAAPLSRLNPRALAALDVALRVPCIFIIDAVLNSSDPGPGPGSGPGSGWAGAAGRLSVRAGGVLVSSVVLLLSQKALLRFYSLFLAVILAFASVLINYYAVSHPDLRGGVQDSVAAHHDLAGGIQDSVPPSDPSASGVSVWLALAAVQLCLGVGFIALLKVRPLLAGLVVVDVLVPLWTVVLQLPLDVRQLIAVVSGLALALTTLFCLAARLCWFYYSCRYVFLLVRHMYRIYGLQLLLEDTWKRIRFPDVLRVFWLSRITAQALLLLYVLRAVQHQHPDSPDSIDNPELSPETHHTQALWEVLCNLIISGCDSTLTVLGMSAVISSVAHYLGLSILAFIGSTEEEDKRLGFVAPVLFFILALQTGLSGLDPEERLVRLSRNMCLLLTAILHFVHGMTDPVLMSLSASHVSSLRRHLPVLLVSAALLLLPVLLSVLLWRHYALNTWLFAVTAFCVELCLKVLVSLTVYALFMLDGWSQTLWEKLDDYVYYVRSAGNVMEFLFGVVMFANGAYTMMFESGSKIRACMMCLHAYFNIYLQAKNGWRTFINRRSAVKKINSLPELKGAPLRAIGDVCAICYQEFTASARITPCNHYFHALCLRKWLYIQDTCPMCHQRVHIEEPVRPGAGPTNNNGAEAPPPPRPHEPGGEHHEDDRGAEINDNDSIEYDSDEWSARNGAAQPEEDLDQDQDQDSNSD